MYIFIYYIFNKISNQIWKSFHMCLQYCRLSTGSQQTLRYGVGTENVVQHLFYNTVRLCCNYLFLKFQVSIYCYEKTGMVIQTINFL